MPSSGILHRVVVVRPDVSEELSAYIIRVPIIGELGTILAATSNRLCISSQRAFVDTANVVSSSPITVSLKMEAISSYKRHAVLHLRRRCC
jgi:hypothetical protein